MSVLGKRGAASLMCESIVASTPSFAKQMLLALHGNHEEVGGWRQTGSGTVFDAGAGGYSVSMI